MVKTVKPLLKEQMLKARGENLRERRQALGMSQDDLASAAGTTQQTINRIELGETEHSKHLENIYFVLQLSEASALSPTHETIVPLNIAQAASDIPDNRAVPLFKMTYGEFDLMDEEPYHRIQRPEVLLDCPDAYAFINSSDDLFPEYVAGDIVLVNPYLPPRSGNAVVLMKEDRQVTLRSFVARSRTEGKTVGWRVMTWEPRGAEVLQFDEWPICHVIVGRYPQI